MVHSRIRIDSTPLVNDETLISWANVNATEFAIFHHMVNDNSHFHLYVNNPMVMSLQSLRYKIKTHFKLESVQYSVKECSADRVKEFTQYCYNTKHGNVATLVKTNLSDELIESSRSLAQEITDAFKASKKNRAKKPTTLYDIAMEVVQTVVDPNNQYEIIKLSITLLHKYCKAHDKFLVSKVVTTALSKINPSLLENQVILMLGLDPNKIFL